MPNTIKDPRDKEYVRIGTDIYLVSEKKSKIDKLKEFDDQISSLADWKIKALARVEKDYKNQYDQLLREKKEIEKL